MSISLKNISDFLRFADKEIKNNNFDSALGYINKIFELDPKNVYGKAYKERIISLLEAQGITRTDAEQRAADAKIFEQPIQQTAPPPTPVPVAPVSPKPIEQKKPEVKRAVPIVAPIPLAGIDPPVKQPSIKKQSSPDEAKFSPIRRSAAAADAYQSLLMESWKDGSVTPEEQIRIASMRETFAITLDEHAIIEKDVRLTSYLHAIRDEYRKGITNFEPLRKKFLITDQEQIAIESKVFQLLQSLQSNGSVLVLDDDQPFLDIIKSVLNEGGFYCFTAVTGEEGLQLLETMTPDIVVCDINFSKPNMSGFAFYEKFRSIDKFLTTPFIFLSALDQDVLVRTGKKLGADDYLFKPIDTEMLLATIEGKLRRSRELKRAM